MARITILGGTGYAGSNIAQAAVNRSHTVVVYARKAPSDAIIGAEYRVGDVTDVATISDALANTDVLISGLSPRGELEGAGILRNVLGNIAEAAMQAGVRLGVIGGAGSLQTTEGGPLVADTPDFPDAFKPEAHEMASVLEDLRGSDSALDWFFVSPAGGFGVWAPGEATGVYRLGGDVLLTDEEGNSFISGADLGLAVVKEVEDPQHRRARFTVAY